MREVEVKSSFRVGKDRVVVRGRLCMGDVVEFDGVRYRVTGVWVKCKRVTIVGGHPEWEVIEILAEGELV